MARGNGTDSATPPLHVVGHDDWQEDTQPEPPEAVTVRAVLHAVKKLEKTVDTLSHAVGGVQRVLVWCAISAGALALAVLFLWWIR